MSGKEEERIAKQLRALGERQIAIADARSAVVEAAKAWAAARLSSNGLTRQAVRQELSDAVSKLETLERGEVDRG